MKSIEWPAGVSEDVAGEQAGPSSSSAAIGYLHVVVPRS
jgi:hypothetical protein